MCYGWKDGIFNNAAEQYSIPRATKNRLSAKVIDGTNSYQTESDARKR